MRSRTTMGNRVGVARAAGRRLAWLALALPLLGLAAGCGTTPPARYFALSSSAQATGESSDAGLVLALEPVLLPELLDRPQLVERVGAHELRLHEYVRWAEPLRDNLARVLAEDLSALLGAGRVVLVPDERSGDATRRLAVRLLRFDVSRGGEAVLEARWQLLDGDGALLDSGHARCAEAVAGHADASGMVDALGACLARFGQELAASVQASQGAAATTG